MTIDRIAAAALARPATLAELRAIDDEAALEIRRLENDRSVLAVVIADPETSCADARALGERVVAIGAEIGKLLRARDLLADRRQLLVRNRSALDGPRALRQF